MQTLIKPWLDKRLHFPFLKKGAMEQQVHIVNWRIIHQPIQFAGFVHISGNFIFNSGTVDRDHAAIGIFDFDTVGVDIELT